jgi:hypothetical protein
MLKWKCSMRGFLRPNFYIKKIKMAYKYLNLVLQNYAGKKLRE